MKKILFYTNQFFGQVGGEAFAYTEPFVEAGVRGNANAFAPKLVGGEVVATIVCGDNYFVENMDICRDFIREQVEAWQPDMVIAGPAFNAGRFGIACGEVCKFTQQDFGIPSVTGLYWENPAVEMYKADCYIMEVGKSAAGIRQAVPLIAGFVNKLIAGEKIGTPKQEHFFPKGQRINVFHERNGAERAVDMLVKKLKGEAYETELEISVYEKVSPSPPLSDLKSAKIALCTTGGIVPMGNPDHMFAATATFWKKYDLAGRTTLDEGAFESVHAGYDPVYANKDPNRVAPYNVLKQLEAEGAIKEVYPFLLTTTGNSTSVANAARMGEEMAKDLVSAGITGVLLTST